ncbi:9909_t:CDS:2, partial [Acaulospora colombiana]
MLRSRCRVQGLWTFLDVARSKQVGWFQPPQRPLALCTKLVKQGYNKHLEPSICPTTPWFMKLSQLPADILLLVASFLDVNTLVSFSQAFRSVYSLSRSSVTWWLYDLAVGYLPSIKPISSYSADELRNAALRAHRAWDKLCQPTPLVKIDAHLTEKLSTERGEALDYTKGIQTDSISFDPNNLTIEGGRSSEVIVPGTPYLFYIQQSTELEDHNSPRLFSIVFRHLRKPDIYQRWGLPSGDFMVPRVEPLPQLAALKVDHRTIRYSAFIRLIEVKLLDTSFSEDLLRQEEPGHTINEQNQFATMTLLWAFQFPTIAEEATRQKDNTTSPTLHYRTLQSARYSDDDLRKMAYGSRSGVIRPPTIFDIGHNIVYWVQNLGDRLSSSPYCAPLVTVVEYHDAGQAGHAPVKRFTLKPGRWTTGKEKYQYVISATLIRAPSFSLPPHWTLLLVVNGQTPSIYTIPSSFITSTEFMVNSLFQPPPNPMDECISQFKVTLPVSTEEDSIETDQVPRRKRHYGPDEPYGPLYALRLHWDHDIGPVPLHSLPQSWQEHLQEADKSESK